MNKRLLFSLSCVLTLVLCVLSLPHDALASFYKIPVNLTVGKSETIEVSSKVANVLVSDPSVADIGALSPRKFYVVGKGVGDTNILLFDGKSEPVATLDINVRVDEANLQRTLKEFFPEENIIPKTINKNVVLTGNVSDPGKAGQIRDIAGRFTGQNDSIVDMMTVDGQQQVLLKVKIVEVQRTLLKELGLEFGGTNLTSGNFTGAITSTGNNIFTSTPYMGGALAWQAGGKGPITAVLEALENKDLVTTLAEPNLTTVSGKTASFLAGGEYPIPVSNNNNQLGIEFKQFGVGLGFTPVVMSNDRISMNLQTEVSALSNQGELELNGARIPSLTVRRAETVVELPSGGTLMIAGLIQSDAANTMDSLPGISQIPILGALFSSQSFRRNESELLVLITAYTVAPTVSPDAQIEQTATINDKNEIMLPLDISFKKSVETVHGNHDIGTGTGYLLD